VLTRRERAPALIKVESIWGGEMNGIHGGIGEQFVKRCKESRKSERFGRRAALFRRGSEYARNRQTQPAQRFHVQRTDETHANHGNAYFSHNRVLSAFRETLAGLPGYFFGRSKAVHPVFATVPLKVNHFSGKEKCMMYEGNADRSRKGG
jgi:hypothetical protein